MHARRDRLVDIARAGDFGCFHDRDAARAAIAIANLEDAIDGDPYPELLDRLPELADHPERYRELWAAEDEHISLTEAAIADGTITITEDPALDLAVVHVPDSWQDARRPPLHHDRRGRGPPVRRAQRDRSFRGRDARRRRPRAPLPLRDLGAPREPPSPAHASISPGSRTRSPPDDAAAVGSSTASTR